MQYMYLSINGTDYFPNGNNNIVVIVQPYLVKNFMFSINLCLPV